MKKHKREESSHTERYLSQSTNPKVDLTFDGKDSLQFYPWWNHFNDMVHRVPGMPSSLKYQLAKDHLKGDALTVFMGPRVNYEDSQDQKYVNAFERINAKYNREDKRWQTLQKQFDDIAHTKFDSNAVVNKLYEIRMLKQAMVSSKSPDNSVNDIGKKFWDKKSKIFPAEICSMVIAHVNATCDQEIKNGEYNLVFDEAMDKAILLCDSDTYRARNDAKHTQNNLLEALSKAFTLESDGTLSCIPDSIKGLIDNKRKAPTAPTPVPAKKPANPLGFRRPAQKKQEVKCCETGGLDSEKELPSEVPLVSDEPEFTDTDACPVVASHCFAQEAITDKAGVMRFINSIKGENCFFPHRSQSNHRLWDCGLSVTSKVEHLAELIRCRACWQEGHTVSKCTVKDLIDFKCDHCGNTNHFKPLCYTYCSTMAQSRKQPTGQSDSRPSREAKMVACLTPEMEQYFSGLASEAAQKAREVNAQSATPKPSTSQQSNAYPEVTKNPMEITS
jgi:hypothetical protein